MNKSNIQLLKHKKSLSRPARRRLSVPSIVQLYMFINTTSDGMDTG